MGYRGAHRGKGRRRFFEAGPRHASPETAGTDYSYRGSHRAYTFGADTPRESLLNPYIDWT